MDMDYTPNPTLSVDNFKDDNNGSEKYYEGLTVKIPSSRGNESPTPHTPMSELKNKTQSWYYSSMYPGYKARKIEFRNLFNPSSNTKFVVDYSCAYHKDILHQGRLYVTTSSCCFYSYIFGWENKVVIPWKEVVTITKEKTAIFIPNAIQIRTKENSYFFATFADRESSHMMLVRLWQAVVANSPLSEDDVDQIIACEYGEGDEGDLGDAQELVTDDENATASTEKVGESSGSSSPKKSSNSSALSAWMKDTEGSVVIDKSFSRPVSDLFRLIYSNDNFYFNFQKERGTTELDICDWETREDNKKVREVCYNMELNNPVGPKKCHVKETQVFQEISADGCKIMCVDTVADNSGVPYADSFSVITHNCLLEAGPGASRLVAKSEIKFKKELWGFLKDKIETNASNGIKDYYSSLSKCLENYSETEPQQASLQPKPKKSTLNETPAKQNSLFQPWLIATITIILLITSLVNTVILYRLSLISVSLKPPVTVKSIELPNPLHLPTSQSDWLELVTKQSKLHQSRTAFLKQQLLEAVENIAAAETALDNIKKSLDNWEPYDWFVDNQKCDNQICDNSKLPKERSNVKEEL